MKSLVAAIIALTLLGTTTALADDWTGGVANDGGNYAYYHCERDRGWHEGYRHAHDYYWGHGEEHHFYNYRHAFRWWHGYNRCRYDRDCWDEH